MRLRALATIAGALALAAIVPGAAHALDECRGLKECVPVVGPWVLVPAPSTTPLSTVTWELRCPLEGYVVGGTDSRVTDAGIDVSVRGSSGSPVAPGITTRRALVFAGATAGGTGVLAFKPAIGCIPLEGGGGRAQTSVTAGTAVRKPGTPFLRRVVTARVPPGRTRVLVVTCPSGRRVVDGGHAIAVQQAAPPSAALAGAVRSSARVASSGVRASVTLAANASRRSPVLVQVTAVCARSG